MIRHFIDIIIVVKRIEQIIKASRITDLSDEKSFTRRKKNTKVNDVKGGGYKGKGIKTHTIIKHLHPPITNVNFSIFFPLNQPNH